MGLNRAFRLFLHKITPHKLLVTALLLQPFLVSPTLAQAINPSRWMTELAEEAAAAGLPESALDQTLAEFIFPGTHASGTYGIPDFSLLAPFDAPPLACNGCILPGNESILGTAGLDVMVGYLLVPLAKTQSLTVRQQLDAGARAFDLRFFRATAADASQSPELTAGQFYIHRTFAGAPHYEIFQDIRNFLDVAGNEKEIIILNFSQMYEGNGEMSTSALQSLFSQLISTVGESHFALESVGHGATLSSLAQAGKQVIVTYNGSTPLTDSYINSVVWAPINTRWFGSPDVNTAGTGYPRADTWNTERRLFNWLRTLSDQRPDDNAMYQMYVNMGPDNGSKFPDMVSRSMMCNVIPIYDAISSVVDPLVMIEEWLNKPPSDPDVTPDYWDEFKTAAKNAIKNAVLESLAKAALEAFMDQAGICPAINDDWDRFLSLEEIAAFTNPKLLPSLVGMFRKNVNIVMADHYPSAFTAEVKRLNQGAARLSVVIQDVGELECHDCFPPNGPSAPDYFPEITYWPNGNASPPDNWYSWPLYPNEHEILDPGHASHWGGPWQETSGRRIHPNWLSVRSVSHVTPYIDFHIKLWDQDNNNCFAPLWCGGDDKSQINGGSTDIGVRQVVWDTPAGSLPVVREAKYTSWKHGETGFFEFDSSQVTYSVDVCQWSLIPSQPQPPADELCGIAGFLGNNAPIAYIEHNSLPFTGPYTGTEGSYLWFSGRNSQDFDPPVNGDGDPIGSVVKWEWDCDYDTANPDDFVTHRDCAYYEYFEQTTAKDGRQYSGFSFYPVDGPATLTLALRVTDAGGLIDIDTREIEIFNEAPRPFQQSNLAQEGAGSRVVTASHRFFEAGQDEFPITCEWSEGDAIWPGEVTDLGKLLAGLEMLGEYLCTASFGLSYGLHTLDFVARDKDGATGPPASTQIDVLPPVSTVSLADALDSPDLYNVVSNPFPPLSPYPFIGVFGETHTGETGDLALSGPTEELEISFLDAAVTGPGYLSFWWKITGDQYDEMKFYMNGTQVTNFHEKNVWQQFAMNIPAGEVILWWEYKDGYLGAGNGSGVIDDVVFTPASAIALSNTIFPRGIENVAYPVTHITQTGGIAPTAFALTGGALPAGMTMSVAGIVSGTPAEPGVFNFQVTATDGYGYAGIRAYGFSVVTQLISANGFEGESVVVADPAPTWTVADGVAIGGSSAQTIGVEFTPTQDIQLEALGFYERTAPWRTDAPVGIWRVSDQQLLASVLIPAETGGTVIGEYRYIDLDTPLMLEMGVAYRVGGWFPTNYNPRIWHVNYTLDPVVSGGALYRSCCGTASMAFPEAADPNAFPGPNFIFRPVNP